MSSVRPGNDEGYGGSGNDTFNMAAGFDYVEANSGNDDLSGSTENDTLDGGAGTDSAQADKSDVRTSIEKTIK